MPRPFSIHPELFGQYPTSEELRAVLDGTRRSSALAVARLWLTEGIPYAFLKSPSVYENVREWLAGRLVVEPEDITIIGSARIGYSLAPAPDFGRKLNTESDLDWSIVSQSLFDRVVTSFSEFVRDREQGAVKPRSEIERHYWDANVEFGRRNIPKGFFDPRKLPAISRYPFVQHFHQTMWLLTEKLRRTPNAPQLRKSSARVYKNWRTLIDRLSTNLGYSAGTR